MAVIVKVPAATAGARHRMTRAKVRWLSRTKCTMWRAARAEARSFITRSGCMVIFLTRGHTQMYHQEAIPRMRRMLEEAMHFSQLRHVKLCHDMNTCRHGSSHHRYEVLEYLGRIFPYYIAKHMESRRFTVIFAKKSIILNKCRLPLSPPGKENHMWLVICGSSARLPKPA